MTNNYFKKLLSSYILDATLERDEKKALWMIKEPGASF